jgi:hypothetical protein
MTTTNYTAFIAGHLPKSQINNELVHHLLSQLITGIKKVSMPNNKWTGYGFVQFHNEQQLQSFLSLGSI